MLPDPHAAGKAQELNSAVDLTGSGIGNRRAEHLQDFSTAGFSHCNWAR
jgi:hypothetical protein